MRLSFPLRCGAALFALLAAGCATVKNDAAVGSIVTPGNTQVPLPPGQWTVLASKTYSAGSFGNGGPSNQHSVQVVYARIEGGAIKSVAIVSTSAEAPAQGGYTTGRVCLDPGQPDYVYFQEVRDRYVDNVDCAKVVGGRSFGRPGPSSSDLYRDAYAQAQSFGGVPRLAIQVNFAQARSQRYTEYNLYFFPERDGLSGRRGDWSTAAMSPANRKYADEVVAWAKSFRNAVRLGTDDAL